MTEKHGKYHILMIFGVFEGSESDVSAGHEPLRHHCAGHGPLRHHCAGYDTVGQHCAGYDTVGHHCAGHDLVKTPPCRS